MTAAFCVFFTGCSNRFAEEQYSDVSAIAAGDRYAETGFTKTTTYNEIRVKAKSFDGRETLLTNTNSNSAFEITAVTSFSLSGGTAKLVLIDDDGNVSTVAECSADNSAQLIETRITIPNGEGVFKLVGHGCKDVDMLMTLDYDTVNENSATDDSDFSNDDDYTIYDTSYSETDMVTDTSYDNVLCTAAAFDGRKNLCVLASGKTSRSTLAIALSLTSGTSEIVIVNGGNIQTAVECGSETKSISKTVEIALEPDKKYIVQLVGNNCRDIELTIGINRDI